MNDDDMRIWQDQWGCEPQCDTEGKSDDISAWPNSTHDDDDEDICLHGNDDVTDSWVCLLGSVGAS